MTTSGTSITGAPAAVATLIVPTRWPLVSGATKGSVRSTLVWSFPPSPLGTLTKTAPAAASLTSRSLPFHTGVVTIGLPSSKRRTVSKAWKPQFRSFWLSLARASIEVVLSTTVRMRRLPAPPAVPKLGNSRCAVASRQ